MTVQISTDMRVEVIDITQEVAEQIPAGLNGIATVFSEHTTAGVTVN